MEIFKTEAFQFPNCKIITAGCDAFSYRRLFSKVIEAPDIKQIKELFEVSASGYWDDHFVFGKKSRKFIKTYRIAGSRYSSDKCSNSANICLWTEQGQSGNQ